MSRVAGQYDQEEIHADRRKTGELTLPYSRQGDDLQEYLKDTGNVVEALERHARQMDLAAAMLRAIKETVAGHDVSVDVDGYFIFVKGPAAVTDDLVGEELLTEAEPFEDDEDEFTEAESFGKGKDEFGYEPKHGHITIRAPRFDFDAQIDERIAPLIEELWQADLLTSNSSIDYRPRWVSIEFFSAEYAEEFLDIIADYDDDDESLYRRIRGTRRRDGEKVNGTWVFRAHADDMATGTEYVGEELREFSMGQSRFEFNMCVFFPRSDLPTLLDRLRLHNEARRKEEAQRIADHFRDQPGPNNAGGESLNGNPPPA